MPISVDGLTRVIAQDEFSEGIFGRKMRGRKMKIR
jgi:hypothetical protein